MANFLDRSVDMLNYRFIFPLFVQNFPFTWFFVDQKSVNLRVEIKVDILIVFHTFADEVQSSSLGIVLELLKQKLEPSLAVLLNERDGLISRNFYDFEVLAALRVTDNLQHLALELDFDEHLLAIYYSLLNQLHLFVLGFVKPFTGNRFHSTRWLDVCEVKVCVCHPLYCAFVLHPFFVQLL